MFFVVDLEREIHQGMLIIWCAGHPWQHARGSNIDDNGMWINDMFEYGQLKAPYGW